MVGKEIFTFLQLIKNVFQKIVAEFERHYETFIILFGSIEKL